MKTEHILLREDGTSFLDSYPLKPQVALDNPLKRPALIVIPGGCYLFKSYREGEPVAMQFAAMGYQTFVFSYPTLWQDKYFRKEDVKLNKGVKYPDQVIDLFKVIRYIRENADRYGIDPDQVYLMGFSAGGHVAASGAVYWDKKEYLEAAGIDDPKLARPNGVCLCYPMIDAELIRVRSEGIDPDNIPEELGLEAQYLYEGVFGTTHPTEEMWNEMYLTDQIREDTPPFFIWHTSEDEVTPPISTTKFVLRLLEKGIYCEYHLFASGHHGMSLATPATARVPGDYLYNNAIWPILADLFLKSLPGRNEKN